MTELPLSFSIVEGNTHNRFWKDNHVAAHVLARSGQRPRLIVAFAAGNEGAALWFDAGEGGAELELTEELTRVEGADGARGISAVLGADVKRLCLSRAALGSVRWLRLHEGDRETPGLAPVTKHQEPGELELSRRVGQGRWLRVRLVPLAGTTLGHDGGHTVLCSSGVVRLQVTVLSGAAPLTPVAPGRLLRDGVRGDIDHLRVLAFLSFEEKLLAGSWRFLTYFGRDTLLAARLLAPVLHPHVMEVALGSVVDRLGSTGEVAHEEEVGDWACMKREQQKVRRREGKGAEPDEDKAQYPAEAPIHDYEMVDDDFLLAPVAAHYLLDDPDGRQRAAAFLERRRPDGEFYHDALRRNLDRVMDLARPFVAAPSTRHLIALGRGRAMGNWRDSEDGLGGGRYPFDVNAVLVPAALTAGGRLLSNLLGDDEAAESARRAAQVWDTAWELFDVRVARAEATSRVGTYGAALGLDTGPALEALQGEVCFSALALDCAGRPIPVMHTDGAFALLFCEPSPRRLRQVVELVVRPFPAGLRSPAGVVVANPALAGEMAIRRRFTANHYHGTVIWSWQQALLAAGLARQLGRRDLPATTRAELREAETVLWDVIRATAALEGSELWSWAPEDGAMTAVPFGQRRGHLTESNAAQLWSTVYLGVRVPSQEP